MTEKELRKLSRTDLLAMLLTQSRENEKLQVEFEKAKEQLAQRKVVIDSAGSLAEASLKLTGIFEAAQAACEIYRDNIENMSARQDEICQEMERNCREKCERLERETSAKCSLMEWEITEKCRKLEADTSESCSAKEKETAEKCARLQAETEENCRKMAADAKKKTQEYWDEVSGRVKDLYESYAGLRELLNKPMNTEQQ